MEGGQGWQHVPCHRSRPRAGAAGAAGGWPGVQPCSTSPWKGKLENNHTGHCQEQADVWVTIHPSIHPSFHSSIQAGLLAFGELHPLLVTSASSCPGSCLQGRYCGATVLSAPHAATPQPLMQFLQAQHRWVLTHPLHHTALCHCLAHLMPRSGSAELWAVLVGHSQLSATLDAHWGRR